MISIDVNKIPNLKLLTLVAVAFASIFSPFWFLFQFDKPLFYNLDLVRLLLLCFASGFAVWVLNASILIAFSPYPKTSEREVYIHFIIASLYCIIVYFAPCIFTIYRKVHLKDATYSAVFAQIVIVAFRLLNQKKITRKDAQKSKPDASNNNPADKTIS